MNGKSWYGLTLRIIDRRSRIGRASPSGPTVPVITGVPTITGTIRTGQTLEATAASVSGSTTPTRTWQWRRDGVDISGATSSTYTITNLDEGRSLTVRQTETNGGGSANATSTATAVPFLLDQLTATAVAAYSFRKLSSSATSAVRIRRADTTEQTFGFTANGQFDQAAYDSFVSASATARGTTWFDQTSNAVNYAQTDVNRQPFTRQSSAEIQNNGKPAFFFTGSGTTTSWFDRSPFLLNNSAASGFIVLKEPVVSGSGPILTERNGAAGNGGCAYTIRNESFTNFGFQIANDAGTTVALQQVLGASGVPNTIPGIAAWRDTGTSAEGFANGVRGTPITSYTRSGSYTPTIHLLGGTYVFGGSSSGTHMSEAIFFTSSVSNEDLNTIIASQGGEYGISFTPFLVGEDLEFSTALSRDAMFGEFNQNWEGYTATISRSDRPLSGTVGYPTLFRSTFGTIAPHANRLIANRSALNDFDTRAQPYYNGATAKVYRVTNGVMNMVRESAVIGGKIGQWNWLRRNLNQILDATSFTDLIPTSSQLGKPYFYRVGAVQSDGKVGTWSAPISFTPTSLGGSTPQILTPLANRERTGTGGTLAAPTGFAVSVGVIARQAVLTWDAVPGAFGYVVERSYENTDNWQWLQQSTDWAIGGTTFTHRLESFSRPSVPYFYRVAAVDSNGQAGAWSAPASFTPANMSNFAGPIFNPVVATLRTSSGGALAAPTGVSVSVGTLARDAVVTWNPVSGAAGYVVEQSFYDPATEIDEAGAYLELAPDPVPILASDMVILENNFLTLSNDMNCNRVFTANILGGFKPDLLWFENNYMKRDGGNWEYRAYSGDRPSGVIEEYYLRRSTVSGGTGFLERYWQGGPGQTFYPFFPLGSTQRLRAIMRASAPLTATFTPRGSFSPTTFNITTSWQEFTYDMTVTTPMTLGNITNWTLTFPGGASGSHIDVALWEIRSPTVDANFLSGFPPAKKGFLRDHTFIKAGTYNRSLNRLITARVYNFKNFYDACVLNESKPWFQIEWNMPKEEVIDFVAYLAAPNGSHPMADLRLASGIPEPWTTTFPEIKVEWGNEAWQTPDLPEFWSFRNNMVDSATGVTYNAGLSGDVAGLFWQMISRWMKESPYWSILAPKVTQHCGGFIGLPFGEQAYRYYQDATEVSLAPYIGGWESGSSAPTESGVSFDRLLCDAMSFHKPIAIAKLAALKSTAASIGKTYGTDVRWTIYEGGPGYLLPGSNDGLARIAEEVVMKSRAAAVATVDGMLAYAQQDFKNFNYFAMNLGSYWTSHSGSADGSAEYITHALPRIIHENISPAKVYGARTATIGTKPGRTNAGVSGTINQIGAYQLRNLTDPSKRMIVLVNRNLDPSQLPVGDPMYSATPSGTVAFNVTTTWNSAASLKVWTAGVGPYRQHNRYPVGQRRDASGALVSDPLCVAFDYSSTTVSVPANVKNFAIDASVGATSAGLPAGSCLILLFEGVT